MHGPAGHAHGLGSAPQERRRLGVALILIATLMAVEVTAGLLASSLALLSDAAHMLTDLVALGLAVIASSLAGRPARGSFTFGLRRSEILSAQANGAMLAVLALPILYGGISRVASAPAVDGATVLVVALAGAAVNLTAVRVLAGGSEHGRSLNLEGAFQHVLTDLLAFLVTAAAGAVILLLGWRRADGLAAVVVAGIMLRSAWLLLRASGRVLLEGSPVGLDPDEVGRTMAAHRDVVEVHDLHVWELGTGFASLSAHVLVGPDTDCHETRSALEALLRERFSLSHTTLQVEHEQPRLLHIEGS